MRKKMDQEAVKVGDKVIVLAPYLGKCQFGIDRFGNDGWVGCKMVVVGMVTCEDGSFDYKLAEKSGHDWEVIMHEKRCRLV